MIKPGYKTTEFLLVALTMIGQLAATLAGVLSPHLAAITLTVSAAAYALARTLTKWNVPKAAGAQALPDAIGQASSLLSQVMQLIEHLNKPADPPPPTAVKQ